MSDQANAANDATAKAPARPKVLELATTTFEAKSRNDIGVAETSFALRAGELMMVRLDRSQRTRRFALLLEGLKVPSAGQVLFQDDDWRKLTWDQQFQKRGRIGRVFEGQAWLENLNVAENVTLAKRHHGWSNDAALEEAESWGKRFGISLTRRRPAFVDPAMLQIHQWVRAFLGNPSLVILERPMRFVAANLLDKLAAAVEELRRAGSAVVWLGGNPDETKSLLAGPVHHFTANAGLLSPSTGVNRPSTE